MIIRSIVFSEKLLQDLRIFSKERGLSVSSSCRMLLLQSLKEAKKNAST